jgi:molybdate transport system substrate-binding protein
MKNGASFDVLVLADSSYNFALLANKKMPFKAFSKGKLAIFSKKEFAHTQELREYMRGNESLKIALPNPKTAPYGRLAEKWLQAEKIKCGQLFYAESASAVLLYLQSGAVDFVITSAAFQYENSTNYDAYPIDKSPFLTSYAFLAQEKKAAARMFFDFLNEKECKMMLQKHGFE